MASKFRSASKYRHVVGTISKKELWYPDLKTTNSSGDYNSAAASSKWIATALATAGQVALLDIEVVGKRNYNELPTIFASSTNITDLAFSPFDDSLLATATEDVTVKLWKIADKTKENQSNAAVTLSGHKKRVDSLAFHPSAGNVLATGSSDKSVKIWDVEAGKELLSLDGIHGDIIHSMSWNYNGSLLATSSKDKKIRIIDPRAKAAVQTGNGHEGLKATRIKWLGNTGCIASTGFSKFRDRQFALWDPTDLSKPLKMTTVDSSTGVLDILYDVDTSLLFLAGKGDGGIKVFEFAEKEISDLPAIQSGEAQKSTAMLPKKACDLMNTEVVRLFKLTANSVIPVSFTVPRKSKFEFQEDLFPPTASSTPALTADAWLGGENKDPNLIQLKPTTSNRFWEDDQTSTSTPTSTSTSSSTSSSSSTSQSSQATTSYSPAVPSAAPLPYSRSAAKQEEAYVPREIKSVQVIRSSKYRHIQGKGTKPQDQYSNLLIGPSANNSVLRASRKFFVVPYQGSGGRVGVVPLTQIGRQKDVTCVECGSDCLDFDFSPFDDNLLATVTESAALQLWKIPEQGLTKDSRNPDSTLKGHTRRVTTVDFHPTANNIVVTSSGDQTVRLWDIERGQEQIKLEGFDDSVMSISWDYKGSRFVSASKDRFMRIVDPRAKSIQQKVEAHDGAKGFKATWMGDQDKILTVGFNKLSERSLMLWDLRNLNAGRVSEAQIDQGAGLLTPYYDADIGVVYVTGKGDTGVKMYEINDEAPFIHFLTEHRTSIPANGITLLPKTMCNVRETEISVWLKLSDNVVDTIRFSVPRTRPEFFQDDIYCPTKDVHHPSIGASEWFSGKDAAPKKMDLRPADMTPLSKAPQEQKAKKYDFNAEMNKKSKEFDKDKFLDGFFQTMTNDHGEQEGQVLKQDLMEGADESEWSD